LETLAEDEQLDYIQTENEKVRNMVSDLTEAIKTTISKIKTVNKPKPRVDFTKRNEDVEGIHISSSIFYNILKFS